MQQQPQQRVPQMDAFKTLTGGAVIKSSKTATSSGNIASPPQPPPPIATHALWLVPNTLFALALMNLLCFYGIALTEAMEIPLELLQDNVNNMLQHGSAANLTSSAFSSTTELNRLQNAMEHHVLPAQAIDDGAKIDSYYVQDVADFEMPKMLPLTTSAASALGLSKEALLTVPINSLETIRDLAMNNIDNADEDELNQLDDNMDENVDDNDITDNETSSSNDMLQWLQMHQPLEDQQQEEQLQQDQQAQQPQHYGGDFFYPQEQFGNTNHLQQMHNHNQQHRHHHVHHQQSQQAHTPQSHKPHQHHHANRQVHSNSATTTPIRRCSIEISSKIPGICQSMGSIGNACVSGDYIDVFNGECL